jgi:flagellar export protein FliJ
MPRFVFQLDPLLRVRRRAEQERQRALAELESRRRALEDLLRRQQGHIAAGKASLRERLLGEVRVHELRGQAASAMKLMAQAQRIVLELAGVHQRIEAARQQLIRAAQSRRAVELLRERRFGEWKRSIEKREAALLDELAVNRAARPRSASEPPIHGVDLS